MTGKLGIGALVAALLGGCSFMLEVILVDPADPVPTFELRKPALFFVCSTTPDVRGISVYAVEDGAAEPVWSFESTGNPLPRVTYGVVPEGFEEVVPAQDLVPGRAYVIDVDAGGGFGELAFELKAPGGALLPEPPGQTTGNGM